MKNPFSTQNPIDYVWKSDDKNELKFYSGLVKFQNNAVRNSSLSDIEALKAIVLNPLNLDAYYHDSNVADTLKSTSIIPIDLKILESDLILNVNQKNSFFEILRIIFDPTI